MALLGSGLVSNIASPAVSFSGSLVGGNKSTPSQAPTAAPAAPDPSKVTTTLNGINYNYGGDPIQNPSPPDPQLAANQASIAQSQKDFQKLLASQAASQVYTGAVPDFAAIKAQSRAAAEANVNPYYTDQLNAFLGRQAAAKSQQQVQTDLSIKDAQDQLKQIQDANQVTGQRATEDTATNEGQINQTADQRQTDQGSQFDTENIANQIAAARNGLTGSGIQGGANATAQSKFNTTESRQAQGDQQAIDHAELAKARTFEDLATSNKNATGAEGKAENAAQINLTDFITNQGLDEAQYRSDQATKYQADLLQHQQDEQKIAYNNFFQTIANPAQKAAFARTYGSYI